MGKIFKSKLEIIKRKDTYVLVAILLIGFFLRTFDLNWDQGFHLHPDERFLTMVGNAMTIPRNISDYINPETSTFNPANVGYTFFVYGIFPVTFNKLIAVVLSNDSYNKFTLQGRLLSAICDTLVIFLIFKTILLFEKKYKLDKTVKYWASFLYAIAVLPIQLSHFFAVDTFLNFFTFASFYFVLRFWESNKFLNVFLSAIFLGLGLASKITALYILPLTMLVLCLSFMQEKGEEGRKKHLKFNTFDFQIIKKFLRVIFGLATYGFLSYLILRLSDPYYFSNSNIFGLKLNQSFQESIQMLQNFSHKDVWYPPAVQWIHKTPVIFPFINLSLFGIGASYCIFLLLGFFKTIKSFSKSIFMLMLLWTLTFFLFQSSQVVSTMRYFIILYPFLAIFSGFGLSYLIRQWTKRYKVFVVVVLLLWPLMFISIYTKKHSRVQASEWLYENIQNSSVVLGEYWDDPLPLQVSSSNKVFQIEQLPVFDPDTSEKWSKINALLEKGDYLVLSSNRGWGSILTVPQKYPIMSKFYSDLFANKLSYKKVKEFVSYPSLQYLGIPFVFPDDFAEEAFTVYDHPKVLIFEKQ